MGFGEILLLRAFGRPRGILGRLGGRIMARMNAPCVASVLALLHIELKHRLLEIGFGSGVGIALAARTAAAVAGVDPSREMVAQASARNRAAILAGRVDLRRANADDLSFRDDDFDIAFAINSMQVWPDKVAGLNEIRRVLKPGGRLALGFTVNSGQPKEGVLETLVTGGLANVRLIDGKGYFCAFGENL